MTRRAPKTTAHVHRETKALGPENDLQISRNRPLRRSSGLMLARKYRHWPMESNITRGLSGRMMSKLERGGSGGTTPQTSTASCSNYSSVLRNGVTSYTCDELINFWREMSLVEKRRLLRIRRDTYLSALDQFLVDQNLCCECHDNVIAEWEDHERKRSGNRSLQDAFNVFPPFLDNDEDPEEEEEDEDVEFESDEDMLEPDDMVIEEEELVFKYELQCEGRRDPDSMLSDEYLAALEVGKRQEDELLRLIQKEERYIIIHEDHTNFVIDLIRCGEQMNYMSPLQSGFDDDDSEGSVDDVDVDDTCPGANTSHLAQEYLLQVLAIKFREKLENAYQEALQHSLAVEAELLRDEVADVKAVQKPSSSSRKKKSKKEKKRRKKEDVAQRVTEKTSQDTRSPPRTSVSPKRKPTTKTLTNGSNDLEKATLDPAEDEIDREVEQFRLLLEKINTESALRSRKKLVLPPGSFAHLASMTVS